MNYTEEMKLVSCREKIENNNIIIAKKSAENLRLLESLKFMMNKLPTEKKKRYDKELASGDWKKTTYYKKNRKK